MATQHWSLATGSWVAAYHYPPANAGTRHPVPLVYLNGGPVRGISVLDHRFLQLLARQGYDVYAYEAAGGGRSDLLPMGQYTISRSVRDLAAFVDRLHKGRVDFLGFSSGAVVLTRAARFHEMRAPLPASSWGTPRAVHRNRIGRKGC
ncbi:alpha/beta fold hydrolase [Streptomyces sp. NPDC060286]|uniref:alpha/beta fold hydrolase n=1 Tax=unclassified Streptomyces TaxID=2593676 RepID=UPI0035D73950